MLGGEAEHVVAVERGRLAGGEVTGQDDDRFAKVLQRFVAVAEQELENPPLNVEKVGRAPGEETAFPQAFDGFDEIVDGLADGVFGREALHPDQGVEFAEERGVLEQHGMGREDGAVLRPEFRGDVPLDLVGLERRGREGAVQATDLRLDLVGGDPALGNTNAINVEDERGADRHSGRDGDSTNVLHTVKTAHFGEKKRVRPGWSVRLGLRSVRRGRRQNLGKHPARLASVGSVGLENQFGPGPRREHQQVGEAFAVRGPLPLVDHDRRLKPARRPGERRRRPHVQPQGIAQHNGHSDGFAFGGGVQVIHRRSRGFHDWRRP